MTKIGAEFRSYDQGKKVLVFKVEHFTKYGIGQEDTEDEEEANHMEPGRISFGAP